VNDDGIAEQRYLYDPYGLRSILNANWQPPGGSPTALLQHGFQGGREDAETKLILFQRRYLDVYLQRFVTRDPLMDAYQDGPNLYQYVGSNPINWVDPRGEQATKPAELDADRCAHLRRLIAGLTNSTVALVNQVDNDAQAAIAAMRELKMRGAVVVGGGAAAAAGAAATAAAIYGSKFLLFLPSRPAATGMLTTALGGLTLATTALIATALDSIDAGAFGQLKDDLRRRVTAVGFNVTRIGQNVHEAHEAVLEAVKLCCKDIDESTPKVLFRVWRNVLDNPVLNPRFLI
jgi:RHS repeat-associated protein